MGGIFKKMTWTYTTVDDGSHLEIYDHKNEKITTLQNDGRGFTIPTDIFDVMRQEAEKARQNGNMERWRDIHIRLADNDIAPTGEG